MVFYDFERDGGVRQIVESFEIRGFSGFVGEIEFPFLRCGEIYFFSLTSIASSLPHQELTLNGSASKLYKKSFCSRICRFLQSNPKLAPPYILSKTNKHFAPLFKNFERKRFLVGESRSHVLNERTVFNVKLCFQCENCALNVRTVLSM